MGGWIGCAFVLQPLLDGPPPALAAALTAPAAALQWFGAEAQRPHPEDERLSGHGVFVGVRDSYLLIFTHHGLFPEVCGVDGVHAAGSGARCRCRTLVRSPGRDEGCYCCALVRNFRCARQRRRAVLALEPTSDELLWRNKNLLWSRQVRVHVV